MADECRTARYKRRRWERVPEAREPNVIPGLAMDSDVVIPVATGCGLATVRVPAKLHRGTARVEERPDGLWVNGRRMATWEELEQQVRNRSAATRRHVQPTGDWPRPQELERLVSQLEAAEAWDQRQAEPPDDRRGLLGQAADAIRGLQRAAVHALAVGVDANAHDCPDRAESVRRARERLVEVLAGEWDEYPFREQEEEEEEGDG